MQSSVVAVEEVAEKSVLRIMMKYTQKSRADQGKKKIFFLHYSKLTLALLIHSKNKELIISTFIFQEHS